MVLDMVSCATVGCGAILRFCTVADGHCTWCGRAQGWYKTKSGTKNWYCGQCSVGWTDQMELFHGDAPEWENVWNGCKELVPEKDGFWRHKQVATAAAPAATENWLKSDARIQAPARSIRNKSPQVTPPPPVPLHQTAASSSTPPVPLHQTAASSSTLQDSSRPKIRSRVEAIAEIEEQMNDMQHTMRTIQNAMTVLQASINDMSCKLHDIQGCDDWFQ
jgi:hypothetical protein